MKIGGGTGGDSGGGGGGERRKAAEMSLFLFLTPTQIMRANNKKARKKKERIEKIEIRENKRCRRRRPILDLRLFSLSFPSLSISVALVAVFAFYIYLSLHCFLLASQSGSASHRQTYSGRFGGSIEMASTVGDVNIDSASFFPGGKNTG